MLKIFNKLKNKIIVILQRLFFSNLFIKLLNRFNFKGLFSEFFYDLRDFISSNMLLKLIRSIPGDLAVFIKRRLNYMWLLFTKYRLLYIFRLIFIVFILYKPVLLDLDSIYWLGSVIFYFFSNTVFFLSTLVIPGVTGFKSSWLYKAFLFVSLFPAFWSAKRFKKRLLKRRKMLLKDDDTVSTFYWVNKLYVSTIYHIVLFFSFLFFSIFIPFIYISITEFDFYFITNLFFNCYFFVYPFFSYLNSYILSFFYLLVYKVSSSYIILRIYFSGWLFFNFIPFFAYKFALVLFSKILLMFNLFFVFSFALLKVYVNLLFNFFLILINFAYVFFSSFKQNINDTVNIFKNFLFSDNYFSFIIMIISNVFVYGVGVLLSICTFFISFLKTAIHFCVGDTFYSLLSSYVSSTKSCLLIFFYKKFIFMLEQFLFYYNLYFKDLSFFGFFSTWYEYLNSRIQNGATKHSLINWMIIHIYLSIIVFWFLDFDFRVSAKTPPKTPYTLLEEAKRTYDWVPPDMDLGSMHTSHIKIYFALLEISFEHVESLQFVYGDFEYIDEEYDHEDDTPDEDEMFNDVEETMRVRDIIDTDIGHIKRPEHVISWGPNNPLNSKTSYERHLLTEIVGEPELMYIEEYLKWAYESIHSPSFKELQFKDSLFSEWVFDPDEDLTLFEFLLFFPLLFFFVFVWFYHRHRRRNFKIYPRYMIPTRRTAFSGLYVEDFLGISVGKRIRGWINAMRKYKAPEVRVRSWYRHMVHVGNRRFRLLQMESYLFEKTRLKLYRRVLRRWEQGLQISTEFLTPRRRLPQYYTGIKNLKIEMRTWAKLGDWIKFDVFGGETRHKSTFRRFERYQAWLPTMVDQYLLKFPRQRRRKKYVWRTISKLPGYTNMPFISKFWYSRFTNTKLFYPHYRVRYDYNYYNYIGWRDNRIRWRRYAFTPGNVTNKVFEYNRDFQGGGYRPFRRQQKKQRLMRAFQF